MPEVRWGDAAGDRHREPDSYLEESGGRHTVVLHVDPVLVQESHDRAPLSKLRDRRARVRDCRLSSSGSSVQFGRLSTGSGPVTIRSNPTGVRPSLDQGQPAHPVRPVRTRRTSCTTSKVGLVCEGPRKEARRAKSDQKSPNSRCSRTDALIVEWRGVIQAVASSAFRSAGDSGADINVSNREGTGAARQGKRAERDYRRQLKTSGL